MLLLNNALKLREKPLLRSIPPRLRQVLIVSVSVCEFHWFPSQYKSTIKRISGRDRSKWYVVVSCSLTLNWPLSQMFIHLRPSCLKLILNLQKETKALIVISKRSAKLFLFLIDQWSLKQHFILLCFNIQYSRGCVMKHNCYSPHFVFLLMKASCIYSRFKQFVRTRSKAGSKCHLFECSLQHLRQFL